MIETVYYWEGNFAPFKTHVQVPVISDNTT